MDHLLVLALATVAITITIAKSYLFGWLRYWLAKDGGRIRDISYELVTCDFCLSFWVAGAFQMIYRQAFLDSSWPIVDQIVSWLAIVGAASLLSSLMIWLKRSAANSEA